MARLGLHLVKHLGCEKVVLEGDSLRVIKCLKSDQVQLVGNGALLYSVRELLSTFLDAENRHVRLEANSLAHTLCNNFATYSFGFTTFPFEFREAA